MAAETYSMYTNYPRGKYLFVNRVSCLNDTKNETRRARAPEHTMNSGALHALDASFCDCPVLS